MTSIHDEINALFSWNPPTLKPIAKKPSTRTCPPGFFDKHIAPKLALEYVKRLPSLIQELAANVDRALLAASDTLPPLKRFTTAERRDDILWNLNKTVKDEKGVA